MSNRIEWRHLRYFMAVAEELHFGKAANRLFISQPGLSRQIKQLEEEMRTQLFERDNKTVSLTAAGAFFHDEVKLLTTEFEKIKLNTKLIGSGGIGKVNISYVGSAMQNVIPKLLLDTRRKYPELKFALQELDNAKQIEGLLSHKIDFGFVRLDRVHRDLKMAPVLTDTFSLVLPEQHPLSKRKFKSLTQVKEEPFILFEREYSSFYYDIVMSIFDAAEFSPIISHTTVHANTIFRLVENNFGISIIPSSLALGYNMKVKFIELKHIPQRTALSVVWNKKNKNPVLKNVLDLMLD